MSNKNESVGQKLNRKWNNNRSVPLIDEVWCFLCLVFFILMVLVSCAPKLFAAIPFYIKLSLLFLAFSGVVAVALGL